MYSPYTITQTQEESIIVEEASQKTFMATLKGMTAATRDAAIKSNETSLMTWAKDNTIPQ